VENQYEYTAGLLILSPLNFPKVVFLFGYKFTLNNQNSIISYFEDMAFNIGPKFMHKYLVVNMHYINRTKNENSGFALKFADKPFVSNQNMFKY
jgi:hypothetical protein